MSFKGNTHGHLLYSDVAVLDQVLRFQMFHVSRAFDCFQSHLTPSRVLCPTWRDGCLMSHGAAHLSRLVICFCTPRCSLRTLVCSWSYVEEVMCLFSDITLVNRHWHLALR